MRLIWLLALAGCNQVYGLDGTTIQPPEAGVILPSDRDRDGVADDDDVCPGVPDDQQDRDGDGFGDACDGCPAIKTLVNHDEDGDAVGDECDRCPSDPDFQIDADNDGVGDLCDNDFATQNKLLLFDAFLDIGPEYEQTGTWSADGDTIRAVAGSELTTKTVTLDGAKPFVIALGISVGQPLHLGEDDFRLDLVDATTGVALGCSVECANTNCFLSQAPFYSGQHMSVVPPLSTMYLRRTTTLDACVFEAVAPTPDDFMQPVFGTVRVRLTGAPTVRFRYLAVWQ